VLDALPPRRKTEDHLEEAGAFLTNPPSGLENEGTEDVIRANEGRIILSVFEMLGVGVGRVL